MSLFSVTSELIHDVVEYIFPSGNLKFRLPEYEPLTDNIPVTSSHVAVIVVAVIVMVDFQVDGGHDTTKFNKLVT